MKYTILFIATLIGAYLRFKGLGDNGFWIDEAFFAFMVKQKPIQEYTTVFLAKLFNLSSEFELRSISAIAGTLTIPLFYFVLKEKKYALYASFLVAVFPLFVFWSQMARPYAFAGLFVVLGWRYSWFYFVAILTTPIAFVGVRFIHQNKYIIILLAFITVIFAYTLFSSDLYLSGDWTNINNFLSSSRWFYVPTIVFLLYSFDYVLPFANRYLVSKRSEVYK